MHKFNTLKYGGGAVTLLPQHVAQRMVRHVSKRNGWNGVSEEVQDKGRYRLLPRQRICRRDCQTSQRGPVIIRTASGFPIATQDVDESYFQGVSLLVADPNKVRCFVMPAEDVIVTIP